MTPLGLLVFQVQGDGRLLWRIFTPAKGSMLCVLAVPAQIPAIVNLTASCPRSPQRSTHPGHRCCAPHQARIPDRSPGLPRSPGRSRQQTSRLSLLCRGLAIHPADRTCEGSSPDGVRLSRSGSRAHPRCAQRDRFRVCPGVSPNSDPYRAANRPRCQIPSDPAMSVTLDSSGDWARSCSRARFSDRTWK